MIRAHVGQVDPIKALSHEKCYTIHFYPSSITPILRGIDEE